MLKNDDMLMPHHTVHDYMVGVLFCQEAIRESEENKRINSFLLKLKGSTVVVFEYEPK